MRWVVWVAVGALGCSETQLGALTETGLRADVGSDGVLDVEPRRFWLGGGGDSSRGLLWVSNDGEGTLDGLEVDLEGDEDAFVVLPGERDVLLAGQTVAWPVEYVGNDAEAHRAVARVWTLDGQSERVELWGGTPAAALELEPAHHGFGVVRLGEQDQASFTLVNRGDAPGRIAGASFDGSSADLAVLEAGDLGQRPTLFPGESRTVTVSYAPTEPTEVSGWLSVEVEGQASLLEAGVDGRALALDEELVTIGLTADDRWEAWLDGEPLVGDSSAEWSRVDRSEHVLERGSHTLVVHTQDVRRVLTGLIVGLERQDGSRILTGDGSWTVMPVAPGGTPPAGWEHPDYDDASWGEAVACREGWSGAVSELTQQGARWVWLAEDCRVRGNSVREAWFRLVFEI